MADRFHQPRRWVIIALYALVAGVNQMLWLNFAPLLLQIQKTYQVSELLASALLLVFPLLYILLALPAGEMTDRLGYKVTISLGAVVMALFAFVRLGTGSFWMLLLGQMGIAVSQPFILNGVSKLAADWFAEEEMALANGLGSLGMFVGMSVGMALTPWLVNKTGMMPAMLIFALVTLLVAAAFIFGVKENESKSELTAAISMKDIVHLLQNRQLALVFLLSFIGLGVFNGLATWLEAILAPYHISAQAAGLIGGMLTIGGIVGAVVLPLLSDHFRRRKPFLVINFVAALILLYPLCASSHVNSALLLSASLGFLMLPAFAILLTMSEELVGVQRAGTAAGILMMTGNLGAVVLPIAMSLIKGQSVYWTNAVFLLLAFVASGLGLLFWTKETYRQPE